MVEKLGSTHTEKMCIVDTVNWISSRHKPLQSILPFVL